MIALNFLTVLEYTPVEINNLIAELQGWKRKPIFNALAWAQETTNGELFLLELPDWANDIKAAENLIWRAQNRGIGFSVTGIFDVSFKTWTVEVQFFNPVEGPDARIYTAYAETISLAIARCWVILETNENERSAE
jgi:hypothetical protein